MPSVTPLCPIVTLKSKKKTLRIVVRSRVKSTGASSERIVYGKMVLRFLIPTIIEPVISNVNVEATLLIIRSFISCIRCSRLVAIIFLHDLCDSLLAQPLWKPNSVREDYCESSCNYIVSNSIAFCFAFWEKTI